MFYVQVIRNKALYQWCCRIIQYFCPLNTDSLGYLWKEYTKKNSQKITFKVLVYKDFFSFFSCYLF